MKTSKKDLQVELDRVRKQQGILHICLVELMRNPDRIHWFVQGENASTIQWGVLRPTSPTGGYVIIREGAQGEHVRADYLDEACGNARHDTCFASGCGDPEQRQVYENRALVAQDVLQYRMRCLGGQ